MLTFLTKEQVIIVDISQLVEVKPNENIPEIVPGDTVKVSTKVVEGNRVRAQMFEGQVIRVRHGGASANFTVRRISHGIGVERTFFNASPNIEKVEVVRHGQVRRAKLYFLRERSGKSARLKERRTPR